MAGLELSIIALRDLFDKDRVRFTDQLEKELLKVKKKEDLELMMELFADLKKEVIDVSPFLISSIQPVLALMIKNHYYKQVAENSDLFEACANAGVCRLLDELISDKKEIRFLTQFENYQIKKLALTLANKFKENDIAYRLELDLQKEDMEWRDSVE